MPKAENYSTPVQYNIYVHLRFVSFIIDCMSSQDGCLGLLLDNSYYAKDLVLACVITIESGMCEGGYVAGEKHYLMAQ